MNKNSLWMTIWGIGLQVAMVSAADVSQLVENFSGYQGEILAVVDKKNSQAVKNQPTNRYEKQDDKKITSLNDIPSRFQIGVDYTRVKITPQGLSSFKGNLGGIQASYEYRLMDSFYGALTTSWKQGGTHGTDGKRHLLYLDVQERFGYTASFEQEDLLLTFFTGLGYRHLGHKFIPTQGSLLHFRYNELYVPVGALLDYAVNSWFAFGVDFTWMPQVYPTVSIVPLKGARWVLTETLGNVFLDVPLDFTLTKDKKCHLILKPFYERWKDGHSTAVTSTGVALGLPGNTYNFWGFDVNFAYLF